MYLNKVSQFSFLPRSNPKLLMHLILFLDIDWLKVLHFILTVNLMVKETENKSFYVKYQNGIQHSWMTPCPPSSCPPIPRYPTKVRPQSPSSWRRAGTRWSRWPHCRWWQCVGQSWWRWWSSVAKLDKLLPYCTGQLMATCVKCQWRKLIEKNFHLHLCM